MKHTDTRVRKQKKSLRPSYWREAGSAHLCVWLFACDHFQFNDVDDRFFFAPWAEQWEIDENRIIKHLDAGLVFTDRTTDPEGFFFHAVSSPVMACWFTAYLLPTS